MKSILTIVILFWSLQSTAVVYDTNEIERELSQTNLQNQTQNYLTQFFISKHPDEVIESLLKADLTPLQKEYILHRLLTEISLQPPQPYFQNFIELMKNYSAQAHQHALEGSLPVVIFNINSKAHGIENIWTAYRTEQTINQLFNQKTLAAVDAISEVIAERSRPKWLGVKNSIAALSSQQLNQLENHLMTQAKANNGLDQLISHVGLVTGNERLINKALESKSTTVRELTLRKLSQSLSNEATKNILIKMIESGKDAEISLSLLHQFIDDESVKTFVINQLDKQPLAENAAFVLSQSNDLSLPEQLKRKYLQSNNAIEQNHILLALKLNKSNAAQLAIEDIKSSIEQNAQQIQWLKSFDGAAQ